MFLEVYGGPEFFIPVSKIEKVVKTANETPKQGYTLTHSGGQTVVIAGETEQYSSLVSRLAALGVPVG